MEFKIKDEDGTLLTVENTFEGVIEYFLKVLAANNIKLKIEL